MRSPVHPELRKGGGCPCNDLHLKFDPTGSCFEQQLVAVLEGSGALGGGAQLKEVSHWVWDLKGDIISGYFVAHALCFMAVKYALLALTD